ncbi:MAG: SH3 domain-containing protein [Bacillus sp. (in: firmicutes)]
MKHKLVLYIIAFVLLLSAVAINPAVYRADSYTYKIVIADSLNVRSSPSEDSSIVGKLQQGVEVKILKTDQNWSKISYGSIKGWVVNDYLQAEGQNGVTLAPSLNVRSEASGESERLGSLKKGTQVKILQEKYGWYYIQAGTTLGWVSKVYVSMDSDIDNQATSDLYVNATSLRVRSEPSLTATILGSLSANEQVTVLSAEGDWAQIEFNGSEAWVASSYLSTSKLNTEVADKQLMITANAKLRTGPSQEHEVITLTPKGTEVIKLSNDNEWVEVQLADGTTGWVASWLTNISEDGETGMDNPFKSSGIAGKTIVLDAGHGGRDSGAIGSLYLEKSLTLSTVEAVADVLEQAGANVILTRDTDTYVTLGERVNISNNNDADAFISVHFNSGKSSSNGIMSFYYTEDKDGQLAEYIQRQLVLTTGLEDAGVRFGNYQVIRENQQPSVLLELGFISNPSEEETIGEKSYREKVAQAVYNGLVEFFE